MSKLPELFPGFESRFVETKAAKLFARIGGKGAPLLLLHGHPQTGAMYHRIAPELAKHYTLVIADLIGYGASGTPESAPDHSPYTKRAMAAAMVELMEKLGHKRFALVGHDRGGRVGYRLAFDHPERITRLSVLDIVPTFEMWAGMNAARAMQAYHWAFLAQQAPFPETLIGNSVDFYFKWVFTGMRWGTDASVFDPRAVEHYRQNFSDAAHIHAFCEDYRAGQSTDVEIDRRGPEGRQEDRLPGAGALGRARPSGPQRRRGHARDLAALGHSCRGPSRRLRPFSAGGKSRRDLGRPAALPRQGLSVHEIRAMLARP